MDDLFASQPTSGLRLGMPDADVLFYAHVLTPEEASETFSILEAEIHWRTEKVFVWGRWHDQPRMVAWYGDDGIQYTYSGSRLEPLGWTERLLVLKEKMERLSGQRFNSVLLNLYRNERDHMGWHSDNEPELGPAPTIASLTVGGTRVFQFRQKNKAGGIKSIKLTSGSVLVMAGPTQNHWMHCIRKETKAQAPRINLTFRMIKGKN